MSRVPPVSYGDQVELDIVDTGKFGDGVAHIDGYAVFVHGAVEGETVTVRITQVKHSHAKAEII